MPTSRARAARWAEVRRRQPPKWALRMRRAPGRSAWGPFVAGGTCVEPVAPFRFLHFADDDRAINPGFLGDPPRGLPARSRDDVPAGALLLFPPDIPGPFLAAQQRPPPARHDALFDRR